jgi:hypothetical protein
MQIAKTILGGARNSVAADRLVSARPKKRPATESPTVEPIRRWCSDRSKERAIRDGQERAGRLTTSLRALGLECTEAGIQMETGDFPSHPAELWANDSERRAA